MPEYKVVINRPKRAGEKEPRVMMGDKLLPVEYVGSTIDTVHKKVREVLDGLDRYEMDDDGYWPTSGGVEFGEDVLKKIDAIFEEAKDKK